MVQAARSILQVGRTWPAAWAVSSSSFRFVARCVRSSSIGTNSGEDEDEDERFGFSSMVSGRVLVCDCALGGASDVATESSAVGVGVGVAWDVFSIGGSLPRSWGTLCVAPSV